MWPLEGRSPSGGWERIAGHQGCPHSTPIPTGLDIQLIAQTFIYYSIVIFGLLVAIPVGITTVSIISVSTFQFILFACSVLSLMATLGAIYPGRHKGILILIVLTTH